MLDELLGQLGVHRSVHRELSGDLQHVLAEHRHPRSAIRLLEVAARRERCGSVEDADVVEAEEAALEEVVPRAVLAVDPPREVEQELVEYALEPVHVAFAARAWPSR